MLCLALVMGCRSPTAAQDRTVGTGAEETGSTVGEPARDPSAVAPGTGAASSDDTERSPNRGPGSDASAAAAPAGAAVDGSTIDAADVVAVLDALPPETIGVVVVRDVALVESAVGLLRSAMGASAGAKRGPASAASPPPAGALDEGRRGEGTGVAMLGNVTSALLGVEWPERRGGVVSWTGSSVRLTLPVEDLLALDPLVGALAGGQATASSMCSVSSLRYAWVTCTIPIIGDATTASRSSSAGLRDALAAFPLRREERAPPSVRAAWVMRDQQGIARAQLVVGTDVRIDVHLPERAAATFVPVSPRLPSLLAAVGEERSFAWWNVETLDVADSMRALPSPLVRAAKSWTGEALVVGADSPDRVEFVFGLDDPGPTLGAFGMVSIAGTFGVDLRALLPGWEVRVAETDAFEQRFEVLSLERTGSEPSVDAATELSSPWEDARRGFATPTVDALWIGLGASLPELASSPGAARHALRLERGATTTRLPARAKTDLAAGSVGAVMSLDVVPLLDRDAIAAARGLWRSFDSASERVWGEPVAGLATALHDWLPPSTRFVAWSCEARDDGERVDATPTGGAGHTATQGSTPSPKTSSSRVTHLHLELCTTCGEGDAAPPDRDWRTPSRALAGIVGSYVALRALARRGAP